MNVFRGLSSAPTAEQEWTVNDMAKKVVEFPTYNVSLGQAWEIVKNGLDDDSISIQTKVLAIEKVAEMETHNSITKDDLVRALRWLFKHYEF